MKRPWFAGGLLIILLCMGCKTTAKPDLFHPGSTATQQQRALRYDPYLQNEPSQATLGARPREYETPPPEPSRARWYLGKWGQ
jgi:hypothetical protein